MSSQGSDRSAPELDKFSPNADDYTSLAERHRWLKMETERVEAAMAQRDNRKEQHIADIRNTAQLENPSPKCPPTPTSPDAAVPSMTQCLPQLLNLCMGMPRKEIPLFDGNPLNYWKFYRGFVNGVAQYVNDPANRLAYLIQYCTGEARNAIDHCTILEPHEGYEEAWRILRRRFGEPAFIAKEYMVTVTEGPSIKWGDTRSLMKLAETMRACDLTLSQLNYRSELNTRSTMGAIINRLPSGIQNKWFETASDILRSGREPTFAELTRFVQNQADAAATRAMYLPKATSEANNRYVVPNERGAGPRKVYSTTTAVSRPLCGVKDKTLRTKLRCPKCEADHYLDQCQGFIGLDPPARLQFVTSHVLCKLCLKPRHEAQQCRSRKSCGLAGCSLLHHPLLHGVSTTSEQRDLPFPTATVNLASSTHFESEVALGIVPVNIMGPSGHRRIYALLDSGSDSSLIKREVADDLGLAGDPMTINVSTFVGQRQVSATKVRFVIKTSLPNDPVQTVLAWAVNDLPPISRVAPTSSQLSKWKHLQGIPFEAVENTQISLILGMDVPMAHWVLESRRGGVREPFGVRTPLGWILLGPVTTMEVNEAEVNHLGVQAENDLSSRIDQMFNLEFNDVLSQKRGISMEDQEALRIAADSIRLTKGHYEIALPWKKECPKLPSNHALAYHRLRSTAIRLRNDEKLLQLYTAAMSEYIEKGYAEVVEYPYAASDEGRTWYLPHHPVRHPGKPNKVRVVFDCACQFRGTSLNSQLLTGPDITNGLLGVLLRFRQYQYVLMADIEAMFHQVKVPESDRDVLRFLWWESGDMEKSPRVYRMTVHPFGATSSPFCASFALRRALEDYHAEVDSRHHSEAKRSFYVDDLLYSTDSPDQLANFASYVKAALLAGGFRLTKWSTNEPTFLATVPPEERAPRNIDSNLLPPSWQTALGVRWDTLNDQLSFRVEVTMEEPTKRKVLSYIASVYDPMGFVCPALLQGRIIFRELCRLKFQWDQQLSNDYATSWQKWRRTLIHLNKLRIPRCFFHRNGPTQAFELHCFSDASENAYGAVVYLRTRNNGYHCSFVCGKSRVAPLKTVTIPRLELTAALLSCRMAHQVKEELTLKIEKVTFWTDSMVVLQTLRNTTTRFQCFVANRKASIHELSEIDQWRYVDSVNNPADVASRGMTAHELENSVWIRGPSFLLQNENTWPVEPVERVTLPPEMLRKEPGYSIACTRASATWLEKFAHFGRWMDLIRAVAWIRRFISYLQRNRTSQPLSSSRILAREELLRASVCILKLVQADAFPGEIRTLRKLSSNIKRELNSSVSPLRKLNPFDDNGLLRVGGRLRWAVLPYETKHPIILPRSHFVTKLILQYYHEKNGHMGVGQVLAAVREKYWVIQGHAAVKDVLSTCYHCRRWFSLPCSQPMAPLPTERVVPNGRPFAYTGVDYFGPLWVKRGRGREKRYGCIFTCLNLRAVHLELVCNLETDTFLCAFSRFVARRGCPIKLYSDNGTNFRGAEAEIKGCLRSWNQESIAKKLLEQDCDWVFSPPKASHRGGVWERLIRSVRRILRALLGETLVDDETLRTALTEIEKILNDRPLVKLTSDPEDYAALTPNHLLLLHQNPSLSGIAGDTHHLTKMWRRANHLADLFWKRWVKEYLPTLQTISKWYKKGKNLRKGDLVLLGDSSMPRGQWEKGVVEKTVQSPDGAVREVLVRTTHGTLRRDVRQLYLLEAAGKDENESKENEHDITQSNKGTACFAGVAASVSTRLSPWSGEC